MTRQERCRALTVKGGRCICVPKEPHEIAQGLCHVHCDRVLPNGKRQQAARRTIDTPRGQPMLAFPPLCAHSKESIIEVVSTVKCPDCGHVFSRDSQMITPEPQRHA